MAGAREPQCRCVYGERRVGHAASYREDAAVNGECRDDGVRATERPVARILLLEYLEVPILLRRPDGRDIESLAAGAP